MAPQHAKIAGLLALLACTDAYQGFSGDLQNAIHSKAEVDLFPPLALLEDSASSETGRECNTVLKQFDDMAMPRLLVKSGPRRFFNCWKYRRSVTALHAWRLKKMAMNLAANASYAAVRGISGWDGQCGSLVADVLRFGKRQVHNNIEPVKKYGCVVGSTEPCADDPVDELECQKVFQDAEDFDMSNGPDGKFQGKWHFDQDFLHYFGCLKDDIAKIEQKIAITRDQIKLLVGEAKRRAGEVSPTTVIFETRSEVCGAFAQMVLEFGLATA